MTEAEARRTVALIVAAFPTPAWAEETIRLYARQLLDLDYGAGRLAVEEIIRTRTNDRAPSIGVIRRLVVCRDAREAGTILLPAEEAWGFLRATITKVGYMREFPSTYPLVKRVVDRLGWQNLCQSTNQAADRARFLELYRELVERLVSDAAASSGAVLQIPVDHLPRRLRSPKVQGICSSSGSIDKP